MDTSAFGDALLRRENPVSMKAEYQVISAFSERIELLPKRFRVLVATINLKGFGPQWEIVAMGHSGAFDQFVRERGEDEEYWGDYNSPWL